MPTVHEDVSNLRVTFVPATDRKPEANWAGSDVIRIQAYRQDPAVSKSMFMGAEFPVGTEADLEMLIDAIRRVFHGGREAASVPRGT
jgi:hypothetical protein